MTKKRLIFIGLTLLLLTLTLALSGCGKEEIDLETALSHAMVQNYANYLMDRGEAEPTLRNLWKNDEDKGC